MVAVGVPLTAVAAWWGSRQDKTAAAEAEATDTEGGPGQMATYVGGAAGGGYGPLNAGVPGVDAGEFGSFTEVFTGQLTAIEKRLDTVEFGQSPTERAQDTAAQEPISTPAPGPGGGVLGGVPTTQRPPENTGRKTDANKQATTSKAAAIVAEFTSRGLAPPVASRLARLESDVAAGRAISSGKGSIGESLDAYLRNRGITPKGDDSASKIAYQTHVVRSGDTLSRIAREYNLPSWRPIYEANRGVIGANPNVIKPGQRLIIPNPSRAA